MSSVTFDKLAYLETLKASGVPDDQARAHTSALDAALHDSVVTQAVMQAELLPIKTDIATLKSELSMVKWMVGSIGFGMIMLVIKAFTHLGG